jgi:hypothetical protein
MAQLTGVISTDDAKALQTAIAALELIQLLSSDFDVFNETTIETDHSSGFGERRKVFRKVEQVFNLMRKFSISQ